MAFGQVGILGGCGGFGRVFAHLWGETGADVTTIDIDPGADVVCDLLKDAQPLIEVVSRFDLLMLCVPEHLALTALEVLDGSVSQELLIADICSVKQPIAARARERCLEAQYVSLHPMFGPDRGLRGNNLVFIELRGGDSSSLLRSNLESWGLNILDTDVETHDRVTSVVQVLAHATLLSFAAARNAMDAPEELVDAMATPTFSALENTARGLLSENPELYHNIQTANPNGDAARAALVSAVEEVVKVLGQEDAEEVRRLFLKLNNRG